jgi:phosphate transport system substrate-binding protein
MLSSWVNMPENLRAFVPDPDLPNSYPIVTFSWILLRKNYQNAETAKAVRELFQLRRLRRY